MKRIIKLHWNNYKNSDSGKEVIAAFDKLTDPNATVEELYELACRFNPECFKNTSSNEKNQLIQNLEYFDGFVRKKEMILTESNQMENATFHLRE